MARVYQTPASGNMPGTCQRRARDRSGTPWAYRVCFAPWRREWSPPCCRRPPCCGHGCSDQEPARDDTSAAHRTWVCSRAHGVWHLLLWGRDRGRDTARQNPTGEAGCPVSSVALPPGASAPDGESSSIGNLCSSQVGSQAPTRAAACGCLVCAAASLGAGAAGQVLRTQEHSWLEQVASGRRIGLCP
jgi:hypothetical protein